MPDRQNADRSIRVWFRLIRLEARMQAAVGERLRDIGVSIPQCDVLTTLTEREGVSQQELATRLYVTKGNISGLIDRLAGDRNLHGVVAENLQNLGGDHTARLQHDSRRRAGRGGLRNTGIDDDRHRDWLHRLMAG